MTAANKLTVLRILLVPLFALQVWRGEFGWAIAIFFLAGATDMLDGLIARRYGQRTPLGTFLDPIADKLLLTTSFILLTIGGSGTFVTIPIWLTSVVIGRDVMLIAGVALFSLVHGPRPFPPSVWGKATTVAQLLTVMLVLLMNFFKVESGLLILVYYLTLLLTGVSGLHYMGKGFRIAQTEGRRKEA